MNQRANRAKSASQPIWCRAFGLAFVAHLLLAISFFALVLFPLYVQELQGDALTIGLLASTALACGILLRWGLAPAWDRLPGRLLFVLGGLLNVGGLLLLIGVPEVGLEALCHDVQILGEGMEATNERLDRYHQDHELRIRALEDRWLGH